MSPPDTCTSHQRFRFVGQRRHEWEVRFQIHRFEVQLAKIDPSAIRLCVQCEKCAECCSSRGPIAKNRTSPWFGILTSIQGSKTSNGPMIPSPLVLASLCGGSKLSRSRKPFPPRPRMNRVSAGDPNPLAASPPQHIQASALPTLHPNIHQHDIQLRVHANSRRLVQAKRVAG